MTEMAMTTKSFSNRHEESGPSFMFPSFTIVNVDEKDEKEEVRTLSIST